jgi:mannose-6-phosphate isomerase-like protein (cupin superfamily)
MNDPHPKVIPLESSARYVRLLEGPPLKSGLVLLKSGEAIGEHVTEGKEEALVILKGVASIFIRGKLEFTAQAPCMVYIPPGTPHDVRNDGKDAVQYVFTVAPVG